jgi:hypothetical protein
VAGLVVAFEFPVPETFAVLFALLLQLSKRRVAANVMIFFI